MTDRSQYISWQPVLTDHQAYTFEALSEISGHPMVALVLSFEDSIRKSQGWKDTQVNSLHRILIPRTRRLRFCYQFLVENRSKVHLFASPFQSLTLMACILMAALMGIRFYLISEPYSPIQSGYLRDSHKFIGGIRALIRPFLYRCYALFLKKYVLGVFAISKLSMTQYKNSGIPQDKLFEFGYFIPSVEREKFDFNGLSSNLKHDLRVIFVGNLIHTKGVDILLNAARILHENSSHKISIDIYGSGNLSLVGSHQIGVQYCGRIEFGRAQSFISKYDVLVLPSRYDGWGVVVNEAICAGVPVICSTAVGAGDVAVKLGVGLQFISGSEHSLATVFSELIENPLLLEKLKYATSTASSYLQPEIAARYMNEVIQSPPEFKQNIKSPWNSKVSSE